MCEPFPQAPTLHMFTVFEGRPRYPIEAEPSLDTRGAAPSRPQPLPACSTAIHVVIVQTVAFRWHGTNGRSAALPLSGKRQSSHPGALFTPGAALPAREDICGGHSEPEQERLIARRGRAAVLCLAHHTGNRTNTTPAKTWILHSARPRSRAFLRHEQNAPKS